MARDPVGRPAGEIQDLAIWGVPFSIVGSESAAMANLSPGVHGDHVMVTSDKLLKMDSKQIHLG